MEDLIIEQTISKRIQVMAIAAGAYLSVMALSLAIMQAISNSFAFVFYASAVGLILGILLVLLVTIWQSKITIIIDNDEISINLPNQQMDDSILWSSVTQIGIGLSYITLMTSDGNYKIDLENLKYVDLKRIKSKLIEVCEAKSIPFSNI